MLDVENLALLGGHLALDFVNTVEDRSSPSPDDVLRTPDDLRRWAERAGIERAASADSQAGAVSLSQAVAFREALHQVLRAAVLGEPVPRPALWLTQDNIKEAYAVRRLEPGAAALRWNWQQAPDIIRHQVAAAAGELLTDPALLARTRLCASRLCGWFYLDQTKNHSRRWCSMRGCGTEEKTRRRASRRSATPATP